MRKLSIVLAVSVFLSFQFAANAAMPTADHLKKQLLDSKILSAEQPVNARTEGNTAFVSTFKKTNTKDAEASCRDDAFNVAKIILELNQSISRVVVDFFEADHHFYRRATVDRKFLKQYMSRKKDGSALISALKLEKPARLSRNVDPFTALTRLRYGDLPASAHSSISKPQPRAATSSSLRSPDKPDQFDALMKSRVPRE